MYACWQCLRACLSLECNNARNSFFTAVELLYGAVYCFKCKDYVYDDDFEAIARAQAAKSAHSLGKLY